MVVAIYYYSWRRACAMSLIKLALHSRFICSRSSPAHVHAGLGTNAYHARAVAESNDVFPW